MLLLEGREWQRSTSHVLSFSTSVLLFRGSAMQISLPFGYWCFVKEEKWSCFADQLSVVQYPPPLSFTQIFFFFTLNWAAKKKRKKGLKKKNQQRGSIRSSSVYEASFKAFEEKHLTGGGMRPNCSQSLLILPVQSPHRAGGGGYRRGGGGGLGVTDT